MAFHRARALQEAEKSVAQGKIAQAIKQYQLILENDPSDVSLLNTVGDLYIRERNIPEGLRQFHRLAEAYTKDGFNVKAIAIYRKISKVDPNSVETLLKLAELYQLQGLSREAREQFLQAADYFKKRNQAERTVDVLRKLVQLDPDNINFRNRLGAECEQSGKRQEAAQTYLEAAEIMLRHDDQAAAEEALKKAVELDPKNSKILIMRARVAVGRHDPEEAENIINASPELLADPVAKHILLDAYIAARKAPEAEKLVREVFEATPSDFVPVASVSSLLVDHGDIDQASQLLGSVSEQMINQNHASDLMESLRRILAKAPKHIATLELVHRVCERTADELTLPEVLQTLGGAYQDTGDLERAESTYIKLVEREPDNEDYRGLLNQVQQKLGKNIKPVDFASREMAMAEEEDTAPASAPVDATQEAMVKEALENSDLFARYNLTDKAIAELDKVLQIYPDQIEVHQRILEISRKNFPERGALAAAQLARIFSAMGDEDTAEKYHTIAAAKGVMPDAPTPPPPVAEAVVKEAAPVAVPPPVPAPVDEPAPAEFPLEVIAPEPAAEVAAPPAPAEMPFDLTPPAAPTEPEPAAPPPPPPPLEERTMVLDLSGDLETMAAIGFEPAMHHAPEPEAEPEPEPAPELVAPPAPPAAPPPEPEMPAPEPVATAPEPAAAELPQPEESPLAIEEPAPEPVVDAAPPPVDLPIEVPELPPAVEDEAIPVELDDSRIEVEFYLENGFIDEARQTIETLEVKYTGHSLVAALRQKYSERTQQPPAADFEVEHAAPITEPEPVAEAAAPEPAEVPPPEPAFAAEDSAPDDWELPTSYAEPAPHEAVAHEAAAVDSVLPPPVIAAPLDEPLPPPAPAPVEVAAAPVEEVVAAPPPEEKTAELPPPPPPVAEAPVPSNGSGMDMLGDLAGDFASSLDGLAGPEASGTASHQATEAPSAPSNSGVAQLSGLLAEMEEPGAARAAADDPETHYNLGVAFREMGLLDEAIGEFQKVVKTGKGTFPPNFLQACSLLAICFMEKKMPAIAVRWYARALETPGLDEEAQMALQYDLGVAYESAGDARHALERFTEVYSQNIDFRDVAEKIRDLQQKA